MEARFIELAGEVNTAMPDYIIERLTAALDEQKKQIKGSRVLIVGLAYKPNVEDDRESPSYVLMEKLEALGAVVDYHDPHVPVIRPSREYGHYAGRQSVPWTAEAMSRYDAALIATAHDAVGHSQLAEWIPYVVDTRNALPVKINCIRA